MDTGQSNMHGSPTPNSAMLSASQPPPEEAAQILQNSLVYYFRTECPHQHGTYIPIEETTIRGDHETGAGCAIEFRLPYSLTVEAELTIDCAGGNVWHVSGGLEDRPDKQFTYCALPSSSPKSDATIGQTIGEFLLTEMHCVIGEYVLQQASSCADAGGP